MLRADHPARTVWAFVEELDLSEYTSAVRAVEGHAGRPAIDPAILLSLWLYGISKGVGSARELERLTTEHDAYRWLCGGVSVNYHTLSDFRNGEAKLDRLLGRWLASLMQTGVLKLERVSQDGMRVRASAGASSFGRRETLNDHLREAEGQIERLKRESEGHPSAESAARAHRSAREAAAQGRAARERSARVKRALALLPEAEKALQRRTDRRKPGEARTSSTDPEARVMKLTDGGFRPAYNAQVVCDAESLLVVGVDVGTWAATWAWSRRCWTNYRSASPNCPKNCSATAVTHRRRASRLPTHVASRSTRRCRRHALSVIASLRGPMTARRGRPGASA